MPGISILAEKDIGFARIVIGSDGIMYIDINTDGDFTLENAKELFEASLEVGKGKQYPNLIRVHQYFLPTKEAREFVAAPERSSRALAEAYVIKSLPQKLIGNFYIRIDKPLAPTKLFTSEEKAMEWLKGFVKEIV